MGWEEGVRAWSATRKRPARGRQQLYIYDWRGSVTSDSARTSAVLLSAPVRDSYSDIHSHGMNPTGDSLAMPSAFAVLPSPLMVPPSDNTTTIDLRQDIPAQSLLAILLSGTGGSTIEHIHNSHGMNPTGDAVAVLPSVKGKV